MKTRRTLETLWILATLTLVGLAFAAGCQTLEQLGQAATTPGPDGVAPISTIGEGAWGVATNPLDVPAWAKLAGGIAALVIAYAALRKAAPTITPTPSTLWAKILTFLKFILRR